MRAWQVCRHDADSAAHAVSSLEQSAAQMGWVPEGLTPLLPAQVLAQARTLLRNCGSGQQGAPEEQEPPLAPSSRQVEQGPERPATRTWQTGLHSATSLAQLESLLAQSDSQRGSVGPRPGPGSPFPPPHAMNTSKQKTKRNFGMPVHRA
jgi:hypothetical protein